MPKTQTISVREFRENLSLYLRATEVKKIHFVVMRHSQPVARLIPEKPTQKTRKKFKEDLLAELQRRQARMDRGEWYTTEEVLQSIRGHHRTLHSHSSGRRKRIKNSSN